MVYVFFISLIILIIFLRVASLKKLSRGSLICKNLIISILILLLIISSTSFYINSDLKGRLEVEKQLNSLIQDHTDNLKLLCINNQTYSYIVSLPKDTKCDRTSDSQGLNPKGELIFATMLNGKLLEVGMTKEANMSLVSRLFPKWSILSIALE